jgi:hypothetical protein
MTDKQMQEPVAWQYRDAKDDGTWSAWLGCDKRLTESAWREVRPLYTTPPAAQRQWVGLKDVEWMNIVNKDQAWFGQRPDEVAHEVAKLVEAKLKEKNNGFA